MNTSSPRLPTAHRVGLAAVLLASVTCLGVAVALAVSLLVDAGTAPHWSRPLAALSGLLGAGAALAGWALLRRQSRILEPPPARAAHSAGDDGFAHTEPLPLEAGKPAQPTPGAAWAATAWPTGFQPTMPDPGGTGRDRMLAALTGARTELDELASNALDLAALTVNSLRSADEIQAKLVRARQRTGAALGMGANAKAHQRLALSAVQQAVTQARPAPPPAANAPGTQPPAGDAAAHRLARLAEGAGSSLQQCERDLLAQQEALHALAACLGELTSDVAKLRRMLGVQADCGRIAAEAATAAALDVERMRSALDA